MGSERYRPLTPAERRLIRAKIRRLRRDVARSKTAPLLVGGAIIGVLWILTLLLSEAPWPVVSAFWLVVGGAIVVWVGRDMRRHSGDLGTMARGLESALRKDAAIVYDIRSRRFAEFEEFEDEGACYVFELEDDRLVVLSGQEFYESARFPSLDFSLIFVLDEDERRVDMLIEKRGPKAPAGKVFAPSVPRPAETADPITVFRGKIEDLGR